MTSLRIIAALLFALSLAAVGCGNDAAIESEDYGNLLNSPQGLVLVQEEHPTGWSRPECFSCHQIRNLHAVNRTGLPNLDLEEVQRIVRNQGEASCVQCHGSNGVQP